DYTSRIASALLQGDLGLRQPAPSWLNEMVPANGRYYSVFPLGAVLSMVPVAVLQKTKLIHDFPGRALAALIAALSVWFLFRLSVIGTQSLPNRFLLFDQASRSRRQRLESTRATVAREIASVHLLFDCSRRSRSVHRPLQLPPLPLDLRFWLRAHPQRFAGALVPAWTFLASRYPLERSQNVVRRFS